jgi:hypothetical protein
MTEHDAIMAVARRLTDDENRAILARLAPVGSPMHGAQPADLLDMLYDTDAWLREVEPFYERHEGRGELPDRPETRYAIYALLASGRELTIDNLRELLARPERPEYREHVWRSEAGSSYLCAECPHPRAHPIHLGRA